MGEERAKYDVIVIGGGMAGISAAIATARLGCQVALVQDRPLLGGNSSSEVRVNISGANASFRHARETGIIEEMRIEDRYRNHKPIVNGAINSVWDMVLWEWVTREANLTLYLNTSARKAIMRDDQTIAALEAEQLGNEKSFQLSADLFIDCSGDGMIAAQAGAEFRMGREGRDEFGEDLAPEQPDNRTMGSSILFEARDLGRPVKFEPPDSAADFPNDEDLPFRGHGRVTSGFWWIEYGGVINTVDDNEKIRDELWRCLFGVWDHIKNHGDHGAENYALEWVGAVPGKRESRRFVGDHILTQHDVESAPLFPDRVAYGGWWMDLHPPEGIHTNQRPTSGRGFSQPYSIPFRCLYSHNIRNLMMAGRNVSVTHVAFGSTRVMATGAVMGQAVGTAAYLCKKYQAMPREMGQKHIQELQQLLLKHDCHIIGAKNEDPDDLARRAQASASSSATLEVTESDEADPLDAPRAQMIIVTADRIDSISLLLESQASEPVPLRLGLRPANSPRNFSAEQDIAAAGAMIPPGGSSWVEFPCDMQVEPGFYWVWLPETPGISWSYSNDEPINAERRQLDPESSKWRKMPGIFCFRLTPSSQPYTADQVLSGVARPESQSNLWVSDPSQSLPQHLDLEFGQPVEFDAIYLTFDTNLDIRLLNQIGPMPQCVRDYALYYREGETWIKILEESGNHQRRRIHRFAPVTGSALRLEVLATNGAPSARVYEIRVYREGED